MKTWIAVMTAASLAVTGCSNEPKFPKECEELIETVKEMGKDAPAERIKKFEEEVEKSRERWKSLSKEEREKETKNCAAGKEQLQQMKAMLEKMQSMQKK